MNALPLCQFGRTWRLVAEVYGGPETELVAFWIDTMCVPLEPPQVKKKAIARMKDVYRSAHTVLVLDEELQQTRCPFPPSLLVGAAARNEGQSDHTADPASEGNSVKMRELFIRLFVSPWSHRLWTLQEAALSKNSLIRFADVSLPLGRVLASDYSQQLFASPYHVAGCATYGLLE
jgi:hypothetical protein